LNSKQYFGTDGIRGKVGIFPITPEFFLKLGIVIGKLLFKNSIRKVIIGKDTRISGCMLESALSSGLSASGVYVMSLGIVSTPAVGYLTKFLRLEVGIVISASHNLFVDNGLKLFLKEGLKASSFVEQKIEKELKKPIIYRNMIRCSLIKKVNFANKEYIKFCKSIFPFYFNLNNIKIVLDCANGSVYKVAPRIFRDFGANLITISVRPNGYNINKNCGAINTNNLRKKVLFHRADIGLAFDGDGDRVIMIDHLGNRVNGDHILYILAKFLLYCKNKKEGVVGTVMSNNGLLIALKKLRIPFVKTQLGDKNIIKKLKENEWTFGSESSGHVIMLNKSPTGDGVITSLQIIKIMIDTRLSLFQLCSDIKLFPQEMTNIKFSEHDVVLQYKKIEFIVSKYKKTLGRFGRILLRRSGTEPCFRIMIEDEDKNIVSFISHELKKEF